MDKTLLISYLFPPTGGVGVQRAVSYAKYLPRTGCEVSVLAAKNASTALRDPGLLATIPKQVRIYRTLTPELPYDLRQKLWGRFESSESKPATNAAASTAPAPASPSLKSFVRTRIQRLLCPDPQVFWRWTAISQGAEIIRKEGIRTILVTAPPFSAFRIGIELKEQFPGVRLISEFRDEWLGYYIKIDPNADAYRRRVAAQLERETISHSDYIVTVTPSWVEAIHSRYPDQPAEKFLCVPNGYDPESFAEFTPRPHGLDRLVITYVGTVYANPVYSPRGFLEAINRLPGDMAQHIEVRFIGRVVDEEVPAMEACRGHVRRFGFLPQAEAFQHLQETDCVLMINTAADAHSGKIFEYLASGRPILAISARNGEIARLIRETRSGWCADSGDPAEIQRMIETAYAAFRGGRQDLLPQPDIDKIRQYTRVDLVDQLARATHMGKYR